MDAAEQTRRWGSAKEKLTAAQVCYGHQLYGESLTRSYYACYQAMWAAVGDPTQDMWRHGGLINEFCRGRWTTPVLLPTVLAFLRRRLEKLYQLRILVDYDAASAVEAEAEFGLNVVKEVLQLIAHHSGWVV
jgi:uncharacterized protein (UPF0332 family)